MPQNLMSKELSVAIQEFQSICDNSANKSECYEYGSLLYKDSIRHFLESSSEVAQLAVQPGSAEDLGKMMKVLKKRKVPFAVKGGGHGMAPTFSSTTGIQISMARLSRVQYDQNKKLVEIGAGCLWEQVYSKLAPLNRNVIGGASSDGVGVAGWLLGGGFSLKSNGYGLGIDHIVAYEIITPDGRVRKVSAAREGGLFQALRGGGNNFGIVTKFVLKTYPQSPTYGALLVVPGTRVNEVKDAIANFVKNEHRREATIIAAFRHVLKSGKVETNISILCVFDAEKPKSKRDVPFQEFKRLAKSGDVWKADPAGWQLGKTELSISDQSLERIKCKSSKAKPHKSSAKAKHTSRASDQSWSRPSSSHGGEDDDSDSDNGFEEISFHRWHRVSTRRSPASLASISVDGDDDGDDDDDDDDDDDNDDDDDDNGDNDDDATLYGDDYDPNEEEFSMRSSGGSRDGRSAKKASWRPRDKYEMDGMPRRIMMTKKMDSMGERNERGRFGCLMISKYTGPLLDKMAEEAQKAAQHLIPKHGISVIVDCWPVHASIFDKSPPGAAFPHERGQPYGPMLAYFRWENEQDDEFWITKLKGTLNRIRVVARNLGLTPRKPALYNNLSLETVPARKIYRDNMHWLKKVKAEYDPTDVMGRAGGHKIHLHTHTDHNDSDSD